MNIDCLPESLAERCHRIAESNRAGEFVLCWLHNNLRGHENPALDTAIALARNHGLPLLVYHGLSEHYRHSSDRLHAFMLQGHRDLQQELQGRGIRSVFDLQRNGQRGPWLRRLTERAAMLVTDEMPVEPISGWLIRLCANTDTAILSVDASCVVAAPLLNQSFTRAFKFRDATRKLYAQRTSRPYQEQEVDCPAFDGDAGFQPLWLAGKCLSTLIGQCDIDHTVSPIIDTPGGSKAGYERWNRFKRDGLSAYDRNRNNASIHEGVSRMSAYLHFGMVSPFRIAREADEQGAEKYLDELLIWRELAFHFCYHHSQLVDSLDAIPGWAQQTLQDHAGDNRESDFSWETLARAKTRQPLWDACQRSLLKHGELHNNVRMTWGKAFLPWTSSPQKALELTLDLNHRYALDGRDPGSYGGILWCFGQFDRPFTPEQEILGTIRPRPLEQHLQRLDLNRYRRVVGRPIADPLPRVAIIGAGLAGLTAARTLVDQGIEVDVFEKSRGVGGRLSTRRHDDVAFDHGAQYFTVKDRRFGRYVTSWMQDGVVSRWDGRIVELGTGGEIIAEKTDTARLVGDPDMNAVAKHLASDLTITHQCQVERLQRDGDAWLLESQKDQRGPFDVVIVNCPPAQALTILGNHSGIANEVKRVNMRPCWSLMLQLSGPDHVQFDGAFINHGPLAWIARNSAKPGREPDTPTWIVHASADWSEDNLEIEEAQAKDLLLDAFQEAICRDVKCLVDPIAHRWRYAIPANPLEQDFLWDAANQLGACGDWCAGPRVEGAFLSGAAMAGAVLRQLTVDQPIPASQAKLVQRSLLD